MKYIYLLLLWSSATGCAFPLKKNVFSRRVVTSFTLSGGAHRALAKKKVRTGNQDVDDEDEDEEKAIPETETETSVLDILDNHVRTMRALERFDRIYGGSEDNDRKLAP